MAAVDTDALAGILSTVDLRVGVARRVPLASGALLPLEPDTLTLLYVVTGRVSGIPPLDGGDGSPGRLTSGDALLTAGCRPFAVMAEADTSMLIVDLELADDASPLRAALPDTITLHGFAALEPAAAALAGSMGLDDPDACLSRRDDSVICRLMATTVLLSMVRAWAANGCAPDGWPSRSRDPFLDRVIDAIHEMPGQDWTVQRLASVGAMSRSVFAERFRTVIGRSPADYVTEVRVNAAKRMLDAGQSVSATSRELGYASDEGFSRAFRRRTGVTPSSWRKAPVSA